MLTTSKTEVAGNCFQNESNGFGIQKFLVIFIILI